METNIEIQERKAVSLCLLEEGGETHNTEVVSSLILWLFTVIFLKVNLG